MLAAAVAWFAVGVVAVIQLDGIAVATIAAVASVINTLILARARSTHKEIVKEVKRLQSPVRVLTDLSDIRERQIEEFRGLNRAFSNRAIELREVSESLRELKNGTSDNRD